MSVSIDVSNYSGEITHEQCEALKEVGVTRVVVQIVNERILTHRQQIPALLAAGLEVEAYVYLWFSGGPEFIRSRMNWALDEIAVFPDIRRVWLDCEQSETDNPRYSGPDAETAAMIRLGVSLSGERGYEVGIYTGEWWWDRFQHEVTEFSYLPLWCAQYDRVLGLDIVPFGGWERAAMKQYEADTTVAGIPNVDVNWYEEEEVLQLQSLSNQSEAISKVKEAAEAVGPDQGEWFRVVGGYTPKPGRTAYLVEVVEG